MPSIKIRPNESFDVGLRQFKRACEKRGSYLKLEKENLSEKPTSVLKEKRPQLSKENKKIKEKID